MQAAVVLIVVVNRSDGKSKITSQKLIFVINDFEVVHWKAPLRHLALHSESSYVKFYIP